MSPAEPYSLDTGSPTGSVGGNRGQSLPDFVIGIAVFLLTFTFILQFVPQLVVPYDAQEHPTVAQRTANDLGAHLLAVNTTSSALNATCTIAFFTQTGGSTCPFDTADRPAEQIGIGRGYTLNVTLRDAPSDAPGSTVLCADNGSIGNCSPSAERLRIGPAVPRGDDSVAVARHRAFVGDTEAVIEVWVW